MMLVFKSICITINVHFTANKHGVSEIPTDVINLISHATQERLRHIVEKLSTIAEQRGEIYKVSKRREHNVITTTKKWA